MIEAGGPVIRDAVARAVRVQNEPSNARSEGPTVPGELVRAIKAEGLGVCGEAGGHRR